MSTPGLCRTCGRQNAPDAMFCTMCGSRLSQGEPSRTHVVYNAEQLETLLFRLYRTMDDWQEHTHTLCHLLNEIAAVSDGDVHRCALELLEQLLQARSYQQGMEQLSYCMTKLLDTLRATDNRLSDCFSSAGFGGRSCPPPVTSSCSESVSYSVGQSSAEEEPKVQKPCIHSTKASDHRVPVNPIRAEAQRICREEASVCPASEPERLRPEKPQPSIPEPAAPRRSVFSSLFGGKRAKKQEKEPVNVSAAATERCTVDQVYFSALTDALVQRGDYYTLRLFMGKEEHRQIIEEIKRTAEKKLREDRTDIGVGVRRNQQVKVRVTSPVAVIDDNEMTLAWTENIREFSFMYFVPDDVKGNTLPMMATVYVDDVIASRLQILVPLERIGTPVNVTRQDVTEAFLSYSSKDRTQVLTFAQGLSRARPDLKLFLDVKSLRSGQDWQKRLAAKIDDCQVLYLCWSRAARESAVVDFEWRHAFNTKGPEGIEPVPLEPPQLCAPPKELNNLHFNDLYMMLRLAEKKVQELMQEDQKE